MIPSYELLSHIIIIYMEYIEKITRTLII